MKRIESRSGKRRASARLLATACAIALSAGAAWSVEVRGSAARSPDGFLRGMTVSCPGIGRIWGTPAMTESLESLREVGVEWVAIHPYAGVRRDGSIQRYTAGDEAYLDDAAARARRAGVELFWKPHLAYWGSFDWRGDVTFGDDEAAWKRFFRGYEAFIVEQAEIAERHGVRLFAVGVELEATAGREAEWRRIIAAVREVYHGTLTYAANWDRLDRVPFWDAVDWIGVQAYFPLSASEQPSRREITAAWDGPLTMLRDLSRRYGDRPVVFAEIGYDISATAAENPWARSERGIDESAAGLRKMLIEVALERIPADGLVRGMFWWKWMPGPGRGHHRHDRDFSMRRAEALAALDAEWGSTEPPPTAPR